MKITHVTLAFTDLSKMDEIPSEFIEPYLLTFLKSKIESVGLGYETPEQVRQQLKVIERFTSLFCGLHARIATSNQYRKFYNLSNDDMIEICKEVTS